MLSAGVNNNGHNKFHQIITTMNNMLIRNLEIGF